MLLYRLSRKPITVIVLIITLNIINTEYVLSETLRANFVRFAGRVEEATPESGNHVSYSKLTPAAPRTLNKRKSSSENQPQSPSAIGKGESAQVADWPFLKSFQSAKSNPDRYRDLYQPVIEPRRTTGTVREEAGDRRLSEQASLERLSTTTTTPRPPEETRTTSQPSSTASPSTASTTIALNNNEPASTESADTTAESETTTVTPVDTSATTEPPLASTEPQAKQMSTLFAQNFHSSIQEAVNRIVKMTTDSMGKSTTESPSTIEPKASEGSPNRFKLNGPGRGSSLSLNILLKNFGAHNLTNLDQIFLKSSHKDSRAQNASSLAKSDQKIEITGVHNLQPQNGTDGEEAQLAGECKIEYTIKHVNISLSNGDRGDYTCDYVIDRNPASTTSGTRERQPGELDLARVCQLQITSRFFSNESEQDTDCEGSHLQVGHKRFCFLREAGAKSLNRKFEFPIESDAFDLKIVHKQSGEEKEGEIDLQIKPVMEEKCAKRENESNGAIEYATGPVSFEPLSGLNEKASLESRPKSRENQRSNQAQAHPPLSLNSSNAVTSNNHAQTRRKFIIKFPDEKHLHALNNRFKVSQSFELGSTSARPQLLNNNLSPAVGGESEQLCDGFPHVATVGQLSSLEYPSYYPANINCSFLISRASSEFCGVLLHFRDFDLINSAGSEAHCLDDYLQIGQTRYCNRYEMIGHKMKLSFQATSPLDFSSLTIRFRSDHSRSGRGFLIKYQQLLCEDQQKSAVAHQQTNKWASQTPDNQEGIQISRQHTVAPPMQQPDFSLSSRMQKETKNLTSPMTTSASTMAGSLLSKAHNAFEFEQEHPIQKGNLSSSRECSQVHGEGDFVLKSPRFPEVYPSNLECLYYVRRNSSKVCYLELTFLKFDLEADAECRYDYMEINNVRLCGSLRDMAHKTTRIYFFNEPIKLIKFKSDDSNSKEGFLVRVEQLECGPNGDIIRQAKVSPTFDQQEAQGRELKLANVVRVTSANLSRTIEYDSISSLPPANSDSGIAIPDFGGQTELGELNKQSPPVLSMFKFPLSKSRKCDEILYGREVTIKSPNWPDSYAGDDSIAMCRYTIMRNTIGRNKICQIELRFVNLRLGVGDCIEVDGYEVLCGFNTRNMVKYYHFDRQSHLTVSFFTGTAKFKRSPEGSYNQDLLPSRGQQRFMIIAKQHECIDGFLAPQVEELAAGYNQSNLLYSRPALRYANRTYLPPEAGRLTSGGGGGSSTSLISRKKSSLSESNVPDNLLRYDFSNVIMPLNQVRQSRPSPPETDSPSQRFSAHRKPSGADLDSVKLIERLPLPLQRNPSSGSHQTDSSPELRCQMNFARYNGILSSSTILSRLKTQFPGASECEIRVKLLPGFCQLQLSFGEFDLLPRLSTGDCLEFVELDGFKYCENELKNVSRNLAISEPHTRTVMVKYAITNTSNIYGFRSVFKQLECKPESLRPISGIQEQPQDRQPNKAPQLASESAAHSKSSQQVDFKEMVLRGEYFELNSFKLSKSSSGYDPNMFLVYRLKKINPNVCKLRLMFYKFDLEHSPGCKRDFLDVNNLDRLCGQIGKSEESRRDYDWHGERDFMVSFVSDSSNQRDGFLLFGQQLHSDCNHTKAAQTGNGQQMIPTFDEEPVQSPQDSRTSKGGPTSTPSPSSDANCYKLLYEPKFELSSPNWPRGYAAKTTCYFLIHKANDDVCSVQFSLLSMILGPNEMTRKSRCDPNTDDTLEIDGQLFCGFLDRPRTISVDFRQRQFISVKFASNYARGFGFFVEGRQNKCELQPQSGQLGGLEEVPGRGKEEDQRSLTAEEKQQLNCNQLLTDELNIIESENFPEAYKPGQDCIYAVRRSNLSTCAIDITMNHFELESENAALGLCENDFLEIDYSRFCGSYPANHRLRFNYFQDEIDKIIKFHSDASVGRSGFSLTVHQVSDCGPGQLVPPTGSREGGSQRGSQADSDEVINYLPDSSSNLTTISSSIMSGPRNEPKPSRLAATEPQQVSFANESTGEVSTLCQFVYNRERQYLLSPNYNEHRNTYDNNLDCIYKVVAKSYDFCSLKLTFLDFDLEPSSECHNDYLLIDNKRYCDRLPSAGSNGSAPVVELQFSESLPREIHLLYHTNAHVNQGRGFKIKYEQQACSQGDQDFRLQNGDSKIGAGKSSSSAPEERLSRRMHFGQLSYPRNYITELEARDMRVTTRLQPKSSSNAPEQSSHREANSDGGQQVDRRAASGEQDLETQHDDLTLRKGIVVAKQNPSIAVQLGNS